MADLENWPTKGDVVSQLGISERSLERLIQQRKVRTAYKKVPGRRPLPLVHPEDVQRLRQEVLPAVPDGSHKALTIPNRQGVANLLASLATGNGARVELKDKFYLTLKEASELSGLPKSYLHRKIKEGTLPTLSAGGYRIHRVDLEMLCVP